MKLLKSKKTKIVLVILAIILTALSIGTIILRANVMPDNTYFEADFDTFKIQRNLLCNDHSARFGGYKYKYQKYGSLLTYANGGLTRKTAYLITEITEIRKSLSSNTNFYRHYTQLAWWNKYNTEIVTTYSSNDGYTATSSDKAAAKNLLLKAEAFSTYRNSGSLKINNLKIDGDTLSFNVSGRHNDTYGFGKITKIELLNVANNTVLATKTSSLNYGETITFNIKNMAAEELKVKVYYNDTTIESAKWQKYLAVQRWNGSKYVNITSGSQPLIMIDGVKKTETKTMEKAISVTSDVSLQKYITKVNGADLTEEQTGLTDRKNAKVRPASFYENDQAYVEKYNVNAKPSALDGSNTVRDVCKDEREGSKNVVKIKKGDTVTYRVWVYNNDEHKVSSIEVTDQIPTCSTIVSIYEKDNSTDIKNKWKNSEEHFGHSIEYTIPELVAKSYTYFDITLKYDTYVNYIVANSAIITSETKTDYRILDVDFIKMEKEKYAVSLEKFVTKVNDEDASTNRFSADSDKDTQNTRRYNVNLTSLGNVKPNHNTWKPNNKVRVEPSDKVLFTIRLRNTGEKPVKITEITDTFTNTNDVKLVYDEEYGIKGNGDGILGKDGINGVITFPNAVLLQVGEKVDVTIQFTVTLSQAATATSQNLHNIAIVNEIQNEAGEVVEDVDGTDNNTDIDYLITKVYAVSLEKFVSKVNEEVITGRDGKRYNTLAKDKTNIENYNTYKNENKVPVEPGDLVTFTIRLKNTGDTKVKIKSIYDTFTFYEEENNNVRLVLDETYGIKGNGNGQITNLHYGSDENNAKKDIDRIKIEFANAILLDPGQTTDLTIRFKVEIPKEQTDVKHELRNTACIIDLENKNNVTVKDGDGTDNNRDCDILVTKTYAVSLQKFVQAVNGKALATNENRADLQVYSKYVANQKGEKDNNIATWNGTKWRNPVVVNKDDFVTYEIQVTNDGDTYIKSLTILDKILGEELAETGAGIEGFYWGTYDTNKQIETEKQTKFNMTDGLAAGETKSIWITLKVSENNIALDTLTNHAEIENNEMKNKNGVDVIDTTKNNNADEDYIVLDDIVISGIVWNDKANGKQQTYNGVYDEEEGDDHEDVIPGIKVSLYRVGQGKVAETISDENGRYTFDNKNAYMRSSQTIADYAKYIKAPRVSNNYEYWYVTDELCEGKISKLCGNNSGTASFGRVTNPNQYNSYGTLKDGYYAYYVEFEYDGIKYTTSIPTGTQDGNDPTVIFSASDVEKAGNVQEDLVRRTAFNNKFASIDANGAHGSEGDITIQYNTNNLPDFMPESNYVYNRAMAITSKTNNFQLSKNVEDIEAKLQHVNMGLKGRDIFDLDISTNVYQTEVTVNGVSGVYQFTNEIHLRGGDIRNVDSSTNEDMTNLKHTPVKNGTANVKQPIRKTDINGEETNSNYTKTGLQVKVTYVLTIQNSSATYGTATQVTDYYDDKYDFVKAYSADGTELTANNGRSGTGYKSVVITTPGTELATSEWMDIYVVLNLRDAENLLKNRLNSNTANEDPILMTFNIAEIDIYKTSSQRSITVENTNIIINSEFTRGLIDKDSAPGSINKETVRTTNNEGVNTSTVNGNPTTLEYYYSHGDNLLQFKAEDDTGAAPVLYFMASNDRRTLTGIVFEDKTITNTETRVKTGNGKLDEGENGVYGATVELVEIPATSEIPANIAENFGEVRYQVETGANGNFTIEGFLPGNYLLRYRYGDTVKTALLHQNGNVNKLSYNGEDYQSTNNIGAYNAAKLNEYPNYWYIINETEGVSTGTDNAARRNTVRENVTGFEDSNIIKLNNMKDLIGTYSEEANGTLTANKKYNADRSEIVDIDETKVTNVKGIIEATKMYASTPTVRFELEKPIVENTDNGYHTINSTIFDEYNVNNMNFGIAEVPLTIVKFNKEVQAVTILDSTGNNVLAAISRNADGTWSEPQGAIVTTPVSVDIAIEEDKLQGAHLQATYAVKTGMILEINFDESESVRPTITGMIDFIDNNLSYHPDLSYMGRANSEDWEITTFEELKEVFIRANNGIGTVPKGTVDPEGIEYTTILKAKENNAILLKDGQNEGTAMITLERILSATDSTIEETLLNTIDGLTYNNTVELTGITITTTPGTDPDNPPPPPFTDRIRTQNGFIIRPGSSHDATKAETIIIHPPTGDNSINTAYFILAIISLGIIGIGAFGIKRFVVDPRS